jgi:hypothetical protein
MAQARDFSKFSSDWAFVSGVKFAVFASVQSVVKKEVIDHGLHG